MYGAFNEHFPLNAFFARCNSLPIKYSKRALIWLALMYLETNIGGLILVGYYVQWYLREKAKGSVMLQNEIDNGPISLDIIIERVFPMGLFTKEMVHEFWDKQKVSARPDNLVDHPSAAASFIPIKENA